MVCKHIIKRVFFQALDILSYLYADKSKGGLNYNIIKNRKKTMIKKKNLLAVGIVIICCLAIVRYSATTHGNPETYEVQPWISVPQYKTDTVRAIEAYERLMDRYINTTERNSASIDRELEVVIKKLDSINNKLTKLSVRIAKIEKTLGIEESKLSKKNKPQEKYPENKAPKEFLPIW